MSDVVSRDWWGVSKYRASQILVTVELDGDEWRVRLLSPLTGTVLLDPDTAMRFVEFGRENPQPQRVRRLTDPLDQVEVWEQRDGLVLVWPDNDRVRGRWSGAPIAPKCLWGRLTVSFLAMEEAIPWGIEKVGSEFAPNIGGVPAGETGYVALWNSRTVAGQRSLDPEAVFDAIYWIARMAEIFNRDGTTALTETDVTSAEAQLGLLEVTPPSEPVDDPTFTWEPRWQPGARIP